MNNQSAKKLSQDSALNSVGTFVYFLSQWLTTVIAVRLVGFQAAGVYALIIAYTNFFAFFARYGMRNYQVADTQNEFSPEQYWGARLVTGGISVFACLTLMFFFDFDKFALQSIAVFILFKLFEAFTDFIFGEFQRIEKYIWIAISFFIKGFFPAMGFVFCLWQTKSLFAAISAMTALYIAAVLLYDLPRFAGVIGLKVDFSATLQLMRVCAPIAAYTLTVPYLMFIVRDGVNRYFGTQHLGGYSSIFTVVVITSTLVGSVWVVLVPQISRMVIDKKHRAIKLLIIKILLALTIFCAIGIAAGILFGQWAFTLLYGNGIQQYIYLLSPAITAAFLLTASTFLSTVLIPMKKSTPMLLCNIIGCGVVTVLVYPLTVAVGMNGATYSLIAGLCVQITGLLWITVKAHPNHD